MTTKETLESIYPGRISEPSSVQALPREVYMVYILTYGDKPIVLGHGKRNRAKVIFDDKDHITTGHIKAIFVRAYRLFGSYEFKQFIINCKNNQEAKDIEANLHSKIGGDKRDLPQVIEDALYVGIQPGSIGYVVLRMAFCSSFDGLYDLKLWRKNEILDDNVWKIVGNRLKLDDPK